MLDTTKTLLNTIITKQEGGWGLTENANDPDGGWTYGGMTKKTLGSFTIGYNDDSFKDMQTYLSHEYADGELQKDILAAYEQLFVIPSKVEQLPTAIQAVYLSCAINRGVENAVRALQAALGMNNIDGIFGTATQANVNGKNGPFIGILRDSFCHQWRLQYTQLVTQNAAAWHDAAIAEQEGKTIDLPAVFRAPDLVGWLNRIEQARSF